MSVFESPNHLFLKTEVKIGIDRVVVLLAGENCIYDKEYVRSKTFHHVPSLYWSRTMYKLKLLTSILFTVFAQRVAAHEIPIGGFCSCAPSSLQAPAWWLWKAEGDKRDEDCGEDRNWGDEKSGRLLLSMGMPSDFEAALKSGSDIVRVGSGIFGQRAKKM